MSSRKGHRDAWRLARGMGLIETVMCMLLISTMLIGSLQLLAASKAAELSATRQSVGRQLAEDLMAEILSLAYEDSEPDGAIGRESESGGDRSTWDDIDDYDGWKQSPPEYKDGKRIAGLSSGWERSVDVEWVGKDNVDLVSGAETSVKRIIVSVSFDGDLITRKVAIRTAAWPKTAGTPSRTLLLVVANVNSLDDQELARSELIQSWGWVVNLIDDSAWQSEFDSAFEQNDVVYVPATVDSDILLFKLANAPIGIVNEEPKQGAPLGLASSFKEFAVETDIRITDNTHYITNTLTSGAEYSMYDGPSNGIRGLNGSPAPGNQNLARQAKGGPVSPQIVTLEEGAANCNWGFATSRRVWVPWGNRNTRVSSLSAEARTIMERALDWAAVHD